MSIITKGMGAVLKGIKGLKRSKTFPGPKAIKLMEKKYPRGSLNVSERIGRTQYKRDVTAAKIKDFRKQKGKFTAYTGNVPVVDTKMPFHHLKYGTVKQEGPLVKVLKAGDKKKDLRKFKEFIKTGTRRK